MDWDNSSIHTQPIIWLGIYVVHEFGVFQVNWLRGLLLGHPWIQSILFEVKNPLWQDKVVYDNAVLLGLHNCRKSGVHSCWLINLNFCKTRASQTKAPIKQFKYISNLNKGKTFTLMKALLHRVEGWAFDLTLRSRSCFTSS